MATHLQGYFLVADAELRDPNFFHTVVLLVQHNDDGALGLVLNRPSRATLSQVWAQVSQSTCKRNDAIYVGGPVEGPLMAVHDSLDHSETNIVPGVHFCSSRENMEGLVHSEATALFFAGFSGWGAGQLESEIAEGAWQTIGAAARQVFSHEADLWERLTNEISGIAVLSKLRIKHVPPDPELN
jgi:putative transcriptional regulator